jgi:two-component system sensor histidine kinase VicK
VTLLSENVKKHTVTAKRQNKTVSFDSTPPEMLIRGDASRINQVFDNIISNAVKYSHEGALIQVSTEETAQSFRVYVKDNGIGIPKEDLRRIFDRFFRVDKARSRKLGGTGLGLSISKEIMEAHGGHISATSELGKGTTMIIRFPKGGVETALS